MTALGRLLPVRQHARTSANGKRNESIATTCDTVCQIRYELFHFIVEAAAETKAESTSARKRRKHLFQWGYVDSMPLYPHHHPQLTVQIAFTVITMLLPVQILLGAPRMREWPTECGLFSFWCNTRRAFGVATNKTV